jgi:hypothetical protein
MWTLIQSTGEATWDALDISGLFGNSEPHNFDVTPVKGRSPLTYLVEHSKMYTVYFDPAQATATKIMCFLGRAF